MTDTVMITTEHTTTEDAAIINAIECGVCGYLKEGEERCPACGNLCANCGG